MNFAEPESHIQPRRPKILITGATGRIGSKLVSILDQKFEFIEFDREGLAGESFAGLIHLAANPDMTQSWKEAIRNIIQPTLQALEKTRLLTIPQFVYASSCNVIDMQKWRGSQIIPVDADPSPQTPYGLGKACCEAYCRYYAENYDFTVDVLRIGWVIDVQKNKIYYPVVFDIYCNIFDLSRLVENIFTYKHSGFNSFYAVSKGTRLRWDLGGARKILNWRPQRHVYLSVGYLVLKDYLLRWPGIVYRGFRAILRNRIYGKPVERRPEPVAGQRVHYELRDPLCHHPTETKFLEALDELYEFLDQNSFVTLRFVEQPIDENASAGTQKLFWEMAHLVVRFFRNQGHSIEVK